MPAFPDYPGVPSQISELQAIATNDGGFQGVVALTSGTAVVAGRALGYVISTAGTVTITFADTSTLVLTLAINTAFQFFPFQVTKIVLGTAVGSFWNLH